MKKEFKVKVTVEKTVLVHAEYSDDAEQMAKDSVLKEVDDNSRVIETKVVNYFED